MVAFAAELRRLLRRVVSEVLYINVFIAIIAIVGAIFFVSNAKRTGPRPKLDIPGIVLVSGALCGLVYGFSNAETDGWDSPLA
ncbi:hypothetical protein [Cryobacterium tagatosivorans]|uniref:hypothetical protein n=1 Tax=Cryobacterium tagatosivorans TaxID=1259199 RepID=UPI001F544C87|nr:hypothetical protein [Cryobacterium tagatosivorans]